MNILFVVDLAKYRRGQPQEPGLKDPEIQKSYYNVATGLIAGNVFLSHGFPGPGTWFHNCNKTGLVKETQLRPEQAPVLFGQTVGYPA